MAFLFCVQCPSPSCDRAAQSRAAAVVATTGRQAARTTTWAMWRVRVGHLWQDQQACGTPSPGASTMSAGPTNSERKYGRSFKSAFPPRRFGGITMMKFWVSTIVLVIAMLPAVLFAQQDGESTAGLPRPKVAADAQYDLGRGGYPVRIFFEEGKSFADPTAHVFYEPLIYLIDGGEDKLKFHIRDNGELILFIRIETDDDFLVNTIRKELNRTAQEKATIEIVPGSLKYRISPLTMSESWFASSLSKDLRSDPFRNKALVERGELPLRFPTKTKSEAERLLADLALGVAQLVFNYRFSGVSDETCEVEFRGENTQGIDLYKEVAGAGGEGFVTRHQAANIADNMVAAESLSGRCGSPEWLVYLTDKLLDRLGAHRLKMESGWKKLSELTAFDPNSFLADVSRRTKDIEKETSRKIIDESISESMSKASSFAGEAGGSF